MRERRAGRERAGLEAVFDAGHHVVEFVDRAARAPSSRPSVCAGTMLAASPPCVTMPCTWSVGRRCWRSSPIADLRDGERVGGVDAELRARRPRATRDRCSGPSKCATALHARARGRRTAPGAPSSPRAHRRTRRVRASAPCRRHLLRPVCRTTVTVMPSSSATRASASPAPTGARGDDVVAARVADTGQRVVLRADREVQRPARRRALRTRSAGRTTPCSTCMPGVGERRRGPCARCASSSNFNSGWAWMRWLSATSVVVRVVDGRAGSVLRVHHG